jgi:hypothetical protein
VELRPVERISQAAAESPKRVLLYVVLITERDIPASSGRVMDSPTEEGQAVIEQEHQRTWMAWREVGFGEYPTGLPEAYWVGRGRPAIRGERSIGSVLGK